MKSFFSIVFLFVFTASSYASKIVKEGAFVIDEGHIYLKNFQRHNELTIDHVSSNGYEVYGPVGTLKYIELQNISFIPLDLIQANMAEASNNYPTNENDEETYKNLEKQYSDIIKLESIGKSENGRDIWSIKISNNVQRDEKKPEFAYIANMHGNEVVGRRIMIRLLNEVLERYKNGDEQIVNLINGSEIFFIPTLNPDGYAAKRRGNASWIDINRDFPDFASSSDNQNSKSNRAVETIAMMNFHALHHIALSGSFHDGATVVNYPWDTIKERPPLHQMIKEISSEYAQYNKDMYESYEFSGGITNGYDWYQISGGMQDWAYYYHNNLMITFELSDIKWPNFSEIDHQYKLNHDSMLAFMDYIFMGGGFITPNPMDSGWVTITDLNNKPIGKYPYFEGEFYKILPLGTYNFKIQSAKTNKEWIKDITVTRENLGKMVHL